MEGLLKGTPGLSRLKHKSAQRKNGKSDYQRGESN